MSDETIKNEKDKLSRTELREQVFISLFLAGFYEEAEREEALRTYYDMQSFGAELTGEVFGRYKQVSVKIGTIDAMLSRYAIGWDLTRMGRAEINILRLAAFEILFDEDIPDKVAVNEAVELAKKYGMKDSYGFVNGILGKVIDKKNESGI